MRIYGNIFLWDDFFTGTLEIKDGKIEHIWMEERDYDLRGTVIPTFINMHTHIGDFYTGEEPLGGIAEIVGPGGFKYRILKNCGMVYKGMRRAMKFMEKEGISHFVDFREGDEEGIELLIKASKGFRIKPVIFGRVIHPHAQGVGLSSVSDYPKAHIRGMALRVRDNNMKFALHASERIREDIDFILSLNPDFLVHLLEATDEDLEKVKEKGVPVVITPRSNLFFGKMPNIPRLLKHGLLLALGTDNGMLSLPSMFREMEVAYKISKIFGHVEPLEILKMATVNPRKILGIEDNKVGKKARVVVFRRFMTPYEIVNKASAWDIRKIIF